ncbi:MAG TPA: hypothetical protein PKG96_11045 [Bacilli bacterium]|nr:hypothetical protein [Bacilli bacterium]
MKIYSDDFLEGIKHPRIQQIVIKQFDKFYYIPERAIGIATEIDFSKKRMWLEFPDDAISSWVYNRDCLFVPEVYNPKNVFRSLLGMIGKTYEIVSKLHKGKTIYDIKVVSRKNQNEMISFKGTDFQMLLLEAAIYKKTGERWRKSKKMWITKLEKKE